MTWYDPIILILDQPLIETAKAAVSEALNKLAVADALSRKIPLVLYHYTSASGLKGIVESGTLWASDVLYLNDSSEISYAAELIRRVFVAEAEKHTGWTKPLLSTIIPTLIEKLPMDFFAGCFCENPDLLSQWRAYGSHGTGYSLGFSTQYAIHANGGPHRVVSVRNVEYDPARQEALMKERLGAVLTVAAPLLSNVNPDPASFGLVKDFAATVIGGIAVFLASLKHPAFAEEEEWRIVSFGLRRFDPVLFRLGTNGLVPYIELTFPKAPPPLPLTEVRHGPASNPALTKRAIEDLLLANGYTVPVSGSGIPLRGV